MDGGSQATHGWVLHKKGKGGEGWVPLPPLGWCRVEGYPGEVGLDKRDYRTTPRRTETRAEIRSKERERGNEDAIAPLNTPGVGGTGVNPVPEPANATERDRAQPQTKRTHRHAHAGVSVSNNETHTKMYTFIMLTQQKKKNHGREVVHPPNTVTNTFSTRTTDTVVHGKQCPRPTHHPFSTPPSKTKSLLQTGHVCVVLPHVHTHTHTTQ